MSRPITNIDIVREVLKQPQPGMPPLPSAWREFFLQKLALVEAEHASNIETIRNAGEYLWCVLANVGNGQGRCWKDESPDWQKAARRAEADYHEACSRLSLKTA